MKSKHYKLILLLAAIIIISFHHNFRALYKGIQRYDRQAPDPIATYEKKFFELKSYLADHQVVGYISDYAENSKAGGSAYSMAQYVLAPTILVRGARRNVVVGHFQHPPLDIKRYEQEKLSLFKDFGNGVILFKRLDS